MRGRRTGTRPVLDELVDALAGKPKAGEVATDRWQTPPEIVELLDVLVPEGVALDPFHDPSPHCGIKARRTFDIRRGEDAYAEIWPPVTTVYVNGPYSGDHPARTLRSVALFSRLRDDAEAFNLCPAAPGSNYWKRWAWPYASAIAWMGRVSFVAGVEIVKDGRTVARAGALVHGNRTEIAWIYNGPRPERFARVLRGAGYPVVVP